MIPAGMLRHAITIQRPGEEADEYGNVRYMWEDLYAGVPASVIPIDAREKWRGERPQHDATHRIRMRYLDGVTSDMRIVMGDRVFTISSVVNVNEANVELLLECQEQS